MKKVITSTNSQAFPEQSFAITKLPATFNTDLFHFLDGAGKTTKKNDITVYNI